MVSLYPCLYLFFFPFSLWHLSCRSFSQRSRIPCNEGCVCKKQQSLEFIFEFFVVISHCQNVSFFIGFLLGSQLRNNPARSSPSQPIPYLSIKPCADLRSKCKNISFVFKAAFFFFSPFAFHLKPESALSLKGNQSNFLYAESWKWRVKLKVKNCWGENFDRLEKRPTASKISTNFASNRLKQIEHGWAWGK